MKTAKVKSLSDLKDWFSKNNYHKNIYGDYQNEHCCCVVFYSDMFLLSGIVINFDENEDETFNINRIIDLTNTIVHISDRKLKSFVFLKDWLEF